MSIFMRLEKRKALVSYKHQNSVTKTLSQISQVSLLHFYVTYNRIITGQLSSYSVNDVVDGYLTTDKVSYWMFVRFTSMSHPTDCGALKSSFAISSFARHRRVMQDVENPARRSDQTVQARIQSIRLMGNVISYILKKDFSPFVS